TSHTAMLERCVAKPVIGGSFVAILENVVSLVDFLEAVLAILVARVAVRMVLHSKLAERRLELDLSAGASHPKNFIVVALGHPTPGLTHPLGPPYGIRRPGVPQTGTPGHGPGGDIVRGRPAHGSKPIIRRISSCRHRPR